MVLKADLSQRDPIAERCDKLEREIDKELAYHWPLYRKERVAYVYEIKCATGIRLMALELQKRYKRGGFEVDIMRLTDKQGIWWSATLEFRGEEKEGEQGGKFQPM